MGKKERVLVFKGEKAARNINHLNRLSITSQTLQSTGKAPARNSGYSSVHIPYKISS